jgi:peroxiredoxin
MSYNCLLLQKGTINFAFNKMNLMNRIFLALIFLHLSIPGIVPSITGQVLLNEGDVAPSVMFRTLSNKQFYLNDLVGEPRLLNKDAIRYNVALVFFHTSDKPQEWANLLEDLYIKFNKRGFKVLLISVNDQLEEIKSFRKVQKVRLPVLIDKYGVGAETFGIPDYQNGGLEDFPAIIFISRDGIIQKIIYRTTQDDIKNLEFTLSKLNGGGG